MAKRGRVSGTGLGPATDRFNAPVTDPTENVIALVEAGMRRQDDLRKAEAKHMREITHLQSTQRKTALGGIRAEMSLRAAYDEKLRLAETARIDAIRTVDVGNVSRAAEVAAAQAATLATQLVTSAEQLRTQVEATRISTETRLIAALEPIQRDVTELRQVQFQQQGERAATTEGKAVSHEGLVDRRTERQWIVATIVSILVLFLTVAYLVLSHTGTASTTTTPNIQVIVPTAAPAPTATPHV